MVGDRDADNWRMAVAANASRIPVATIGFLIESLQNVMGPLIVSTLLILL